MLPSVAELGRPPLHKSKNEKSRPGKGTSWLKPGKSALCSIRKCVLFKIKAILRLNIQCLGMLLRWQTNIQWKHNFLDDAADNVL